MIWITATLAHAAPSGAYDLATDSYADIVGGISWKGPDQLGHALAAGDLNEDGKLDLVASAPHGEWVHIHFGSFGFGATSVARSDAYYEGLPAGVEAGWAVAVGDLTGDGKDDLIVSEPSWDMGKGRVVVLRGPLAGGGVGGVWYDAGSPEVVSILEGGIGWYAGWETALGDFDGDGRQDLAVGGCAAADPQDEWPRPVGVVAIVSGTQLAPRMDLTTQATSLVWGMGSTGCAVANAGDTNGDSFDDLLIGSPQLGGLPPITANGAVTVVEGRESWAPEYRLAFYQRTSLALLTHPGIYTLTGPASIGQNVGHSVAGAGDVNAWLVYGAPDAVGLTGVSELDLVAAATFEGTASDHVGIDVTSSPDLDSDGSTDLLFGGLGGAGYLFYGDHDPSATFTYTCPAGNQCRVNLPTGGLVGAFDVASPDASWSGATPSNYASPNYVGRVLLGTGDLTGQGSPSIVLGAPAIQSFGATSYGPGHVYIIDAK